MYQISNAKIQMMLDCERCFWMRENRRLRRPKFGSVSVAMTMDKLAKDYMDKKRGEQSEVVDNLLPHPDQQKIDLWRNWKAGLVAIDKGIKLSGAIDDILTNGHEFAPIDFKTVAEEDQAEAGSLGYQLDLYAILLEANGMPTLDHGYLYFSYPESRVTFARKIVTWKLEPDRARELVKRAIKIIEGPEPEPGYECDYCLYGIQSSWAVRDAKQEKEKNNANTSS